jgi:hypothetical protein
MGHWSLGGCDRTRSQMGVCANRLANRVGLRRRLRTLARSVHTFLFRHVGALREHCVCVLLTAACSSPSPPASGDASGTGLSCLACPDSAADVPLATTVGNLLGGCAGEDCHNIGQSGLVITGARDFHSFVRVRSVEMPSLYRVNPGDPAQSYMYLKVVCDGGIVGSCMPPSSPLPPALVQDVHDWIEAGAPTQ